MAEKVGLSGLISIEMWTMPFGAITKGIKKTTKFQQYSKMAKGDFSNMSDRWKGFRTEKENIVMFKDYDDFKDVFDVMVPALSKKIDKLSDTLKK